MFRTKGRFENQAAPTRQNLSTAGSIQQVSCLAVGRRRMKGVLGLPNLKLEPLWRGLTVLDLEAEPFFFRQDPQVGAGTTLEPSPGLYPLAGDRDGIPVL